MEDQKISVVTVSYNQGEFIRDNIESILNQGYQNFEHIVVDGGSTDETVEVLKSYNHLNWTSEPDNGQSDALNKGFARATGDIIVWLNSDDWLAPNIFPELAEALKEHRVVMGAAAQTDRSGNVTEVVENIERSWFDMLKFWVPHSWVAQPSIFFQRSLLEEVRLAPGRYIDEDLFFCMDYDLWMRLARESRFIKKLDKICSYFRVYEENKTGRDGEAVQRECSRVLRRHSTLALVPERRISLILAVEELSGDPLAATLQSIAGQSYRDLEVIFVSRNPSIKERELREVVKEFDAVMPDFCLRAHPEPVETLLAAYNAGVDASRGLYLAFLESGDVLDQDFCREMEALFTVDAIGVSLPLGGKAELQKRLAATGNENFLVSPTSVFDQPLYSPKLAIKKMAFLDLLGFQYPDSLLMGVPDLIFRAVWRSWGVNTNSRLTVAERRDYSLEQELYPYFQLYVAAQLICDYTRIAEEDSFTKFKCEKGVGITFRSEIIENSQEVLKRAFRDWHRFAYLNDSKALLDLTQYRPDFGPAWYLLAKYYKEQGEDAKAAECLARLKSLGA